MTLHAIAPLLGIAVLPGLLLGLALGLRGWVLTGAAPVLTFGIVGIAGPLVPHWSLPMFVGATLLLAGLCLLARRLLVRVLHGAPSAAEERTHWSPPAHLAVAGAVAVSAAVGLWAGWNATQGLTALPQEWDGFWHMNAVAFIARSGESAPEALRALNDVTGPFFYPNGYHILLATLVGTTGASPVAAIDAAVALTPGAFAVGTVALIRASGGRATLAASTGLLCCAFTGYPFDAIAFGPLFPYATGLALLPGFLALLATLLGHRREGPLGFPIALAVGAIGLVAVHPSVLIAAAVFGVALLAQRLLERRCGPAELWTLAAAAVLTVGLGLPTLRSTLSAPSGGFDWPGTSNPADAVGALMTFGHGMPFPQYWLAGLCAVGLLWRGALRPMTWYVVGGIGFAGLFVLATCYEGPLVAALTAPWWNDGWRFAALWTLTALVAAGTGMVALVDAVAKGLRRIPSAAAARPLLVPATAAAVVAVVVVTGTNGLYHGRNERRLGEMYSPARTVTPDELRTFQYLASVVPRGERVMNDPYDGSPAMYATAGVLPLFASPTFGAELDAMAPDRKLMWTAFSTFAGDPEVAAAVRSLGLRYVVIGAGLVGRTDHIPGLTDLDRVPGLELVHTDGASRVYRISG